MTLMTYYCSTRTERISEGLQIHLSGATATLPPVSGPLNVESSSTDKSCSAYIARKWEQLGDVPEANIYNQRTTGAEKSSLSAVLELGPGQGEPDDEEDDSDPVPEVTFLDSRKYPAKGIIKLSYGPPEPKIQKLCVMIGGENKVHSIPVPVTESRSNYEGCVGSNDDLRTSEPEEPAALGASSKPASETDRESAGFAGSTVADALFAPERSTHFRISDTASVTSVDVPEVPSRSAELSGGSRALIKKYFEAATPVRLSPG